MLLLLFCAPLFAQRHVDFILDAAFSTSGGFGFGVDWFVSDRVSFEMKGRRSNRSVPIETSSRASFPGTQSSVELNVKPLIVGFGNACRF